jgi:hypothetical protein
MTNEAKSEKVLRVSPYVPYDPKQWVRVHSEGHMVVPPSSGGKEVNAW